jgi:hypothetical protein
MAIEISADQPHARGGIAFLSTHLLPRKQAAVLPRN